MTGVDAITAEHVDEVLATTRAVRRRLDLDRPVDKQLLLDCIDLAEQAPTGGNLGSRPASVAEFGHGVEQRRALLIGGQRRAGHVHRSRPLDGGGLGVADHPHRVLAVRRQPRQPPGMGHQGPHGRADVLDERIGAAGLAHRGEYGRGVGRGPRGVTFQAPMRGSTHRPSR